MTYRKTMSSLVTVVCAIISLHIFANGEENYVVFPGETAETAGMGLNNQTAFETTLCAPEEYLYQGDQGGDGICDCKPAHVYNAEDDKCYPLFQRGFCKRNQQVRLDEDGFTPVCKLNICAVNGPGQVIYKGTCVRLGDPCLPDDRFVYKVNELTLEVDCLREYQLVRSHADDGTESSEPAPPAPIACAKGTKRRFKKLCT